MDVKRPLDDPSSIIDEKTASSTDISTIQTDSAVLVKPEAPKSKKQLKREAKWLKQKTYFQQKRKQKRIEKRERVKQKRQKIAASDNAAEQKEVAAESMEDVADQAASLQALLGTKRRRELMSEFMKSDQAQRVVIDCSFDDLMTEKEIRSLSVQIRHSYGSNMKVDKPFRLVVTSCVSGTRTYDAIAHGISVDRWLIEFTSKPYLEVFDRSSLVYLTSEADDTLNELDHSKVYIIGGLVDHNRLKGLTHQRCLELGIPTVKLPIGNYLEGSGRKVLAVNHVFDLLLEFSRCHDWTTSLLKVLPPRKGFVAKSQTHDNGDDDDEDEDEHHNSTNGQFGKAL